MGSLREIAKSCYQFSRARSWVVATGAWLIGAVALAQGDPVPVPSDSHNAASIYMDKIRDTEKRVSQLLEQARNKKDVIKLNCVQDKLVQVRSHLIVAEQSMASFDSAPDQKEKAHASSRVEILSEKVGVLRTEAENCIGEEASYVGKTETSMEVESSVPQEDPTRSDSTLEVGLAPAASPFL